MSPEPTPSADAAGRGHSSLAVIARRANPDDAERFGALVEAVDRETAFMLFEPGERSYAPEAMRRRIESGRVDDGSAIFVAEIDGELVGSVGATRGHIRRVRHRASLVIGVRQAFVGHGIGGLLLEAIEEWARAVGITRLELTVMAHNARAIALYRRHGFEPEGTKRESLIVDGAIVDELAMAKLLR